MFIEAKKRNSNVLVEKHIALKIPLKMVTFDTSVSDFSFLFYKEMLSSLLAGAGFPVGPGMTEVEPSMTFSS